jgi:type II secretory pathway component PulK
MKRYSSTRGSTLLIVFWAVAVMSVCVLGLVEYLYSDLDETTALKEDSRARQLAESGVAVATNPQVTLRYDPVLKQTFAPGESFDVRLRSEGGRLNINTVLQSQQWTILENLFSEWGMEAADIANLMQGFKARWVLPPAGMEVKSGTSTMVQLFQSVDQMLAVPGMAAAAKANPDWRDSFTVWSDGPLDLNDATADLIAAVTGVGEARAEQFVSMRNGPDGKPFTEDDLVFTSMDQARTMLGMSPEAFADIQNLVSLQDSTARIESTGTVGNFRRKITVVVRRNAAPPVYFLWQES